MSILYLMPRMSNTLWWIRQVMPCSSSLTEEKVILGLFLFTPPSQSQFQPLKHHPLTLASPYRVSLVTGHANVVKTARSCSMYALRSGPRRICHLPSEAGQRSEPSGRRRLHMDSATHHLQTHARGVSRWVIGGARWGKCRAKTPGFNDMARHYVKACLYDYLVYVSTH